MLLFMQVNSASKGTFQNFEATIKFTCEVLSYYRASDPKGCACKNAILINILLNHIRKVTIAIALAMGPANMFSYGEGEHV